MPLRTLLGVLAIMLALTAVAAPPAGASQRRSICVARVAVQDSPGGYVVGYLFRPERVTVVRRSANRRYARIRTSTGLRGWIPARALCRR